MNHEKEDSTRNRYANVRLIGPAQGDNFIVHQAARFRIEDDGSITRLHENLIVECR